MAGVGSRSRPLSIATGARIVNGTGVSMRNSTVANVLNGASRVIDDRPRARNPFAITPSPGGNRPSTNQFNRPWAMPRRTSYADRMACPPPARRDVLGNKGPVFAGQQLSIAEMLPRKTTSNAAASDAQLQSGQLMQNSSNVQPVILSPDATINAKSVTKSPNAEQVPCDQLVQALLDNAKALASAQVYGINASIDTVGMAGDDTFDIDSQMNDDLLGILDQDHTAKSISSRSQSVSSSNTPQLRTQDTSTYLIEPDVGNSSDLASSAKLRARNMKRKRPIQLVSLFIVNIEPCRISEARQIMQDCGVHVQGIILMNWVACNEALMLAVEASSWDLIKHQIETLCEWECVESFDLVRRSSATNKWTLTRQSQKHAVHQLAKAMYHGNRYPEPKSQSLDAFFNDLLSQMPAETRDMVDQELSRLESLNQDATSNKSSTTPLNVPDLSSLVAGMPPHANDASPVNVPFPFGPSFALNDFSDDDTGFDKAPEPPLRH